MTAKPLQSEDASLKPVANRGRFRSDPERRKRDARKQVLTDGLLACYEIIDEIRKELAEIEAASKASTA